MYGKGWHRGRRRTVEETLHLDVLRLLKKEVLRPNTSWIISMGGKVSIHIRNIQNWMILSYTMKESGEEMSFPVEIDRTLCNYGGSRPWFLCPDLRCGRRSRFLYLTGKYFVCRSCARLTYRSRQVHRNISEMMAHAGMRGPDEDKPIRKLLYRLARMSNPERIARMKRRIERLFELRREDNRRLMRLCRM